MGCFTGNSHIYSQAIHYFTLTTVRLSRKLATWMEWIPFKWWHSLDHQALIYSCSHWTATSVLRLASISALAPVGRTNQDQDISKMACLLAYLVLLFAGCLTVNAQSATTLPVNYPAKDLGESEQTCPPEEQRETAQAEIEQEVRGLIQNTVIAGKDHFIMPVS